jgi:hypothetical protein
MRLYFSTRLARFLSFGKRLTTLAHFLLKELTCFRNTWGIVFMAHSLCIVDRAESHLMVRVATGQRQVRAWGDEVSRRTQPMDLECRGAGEAALEPVDQAE